MIQAKAPGKLYIAGEYAVLEAGHPAVIVALNQFITVSLQPTSTIGSIHSSHFNGMTLPLKRKNGKVYVDNRENPFAYVLEAVTITEKYIQELGEELHFFDMDIQSDLDNNDGRKYGLGSSGAVTVATITALLKFYNLVIDPQTIYKLSALAHLAVNSNGSFGDIAASSYGGWIAYSCFDKNWVIQKQKEVSTLTLISLTWPKLMVTPLTPPKELQLLIGWSGTPASTTRLVDDLNKEKDEIHEYYEQFLANSYNCVHQIIKAFENKDFNQIQVGIRENRKLLHTLSKCTGLHIETKALTQLCTIAEKYHGAAKSSGAGGGDCGIVIIDRKYPTILLFEQWKHKGIIHLPLSVYYHEQPKPVFPSNI